MKKNDVIAYFGSPKAVSQVLDCTTSAVYLWPEIVPWSRQCELEVITGGALKADKKQSDHRKNLANVLVNQRIANENARQAGL